MLEEIERGIRITHEWVRKHDVKQQVVEATYDEQEGRLNLSIDGHDVFLTMGETIYFLAHMAWLYEQGGG
jgi:hypothetical protein